MTDYYRITAYNPDNDISIIIDCNGRYEKLWQFSAFLVAKGFDILEVGNSEKFIDGNISKVPEEPDKLILRAYAKGKPVYNGNAVEVGVKYYIPVKEARQ